MHTVFRALMKEKHTSRGGKPFLSLLLVDRTGEVDGRVFENVGPADHAFSNDDYLLVKGKVGTFHGKTQLVIERLERLDPGPIDAAEFAWTPAPPKEHAPRHEEAHAAPVNKVRLSKRLERLLENPQLAQALDTFVAHLEKAVLAQSGGKPVEKSERHEPRHERPERERKPRGPKVEHKPDASHKPEHKAEPKRDPNLPEGLAFKPFTALVGQDEKPAAPAPAAPAEPPTS
ncbi:MAG: hypothetical protein U0228_19420 [Myxococcaceae bacterium]